MEAILVVAISGVFGLFGAFIAHKKNRNTIRWFVLTAIFIIPVFIVLFLPKITTGEDNENGETAGRSTPFPIGKIVSGIIIIIFAFVYTFFIENKKEATAVKAKKDLIAMCHSDKECLEKIEKNFDTCIEANLTVKKTGRRSREVVLDDDNLKSCIGI